MDEFPRRLYRKWKVSAAVSFSPRGERIARIQREAPLNQTGGMGGEEGGC